MSQASSCRRCRFFYIRVSLKSYLRRGVSRVIVVLRPVEEEERTFARTLQLLVLAVMLLIVEPTSFLLATRNLLGAAHFVFMSSMKLAQISTLYGYVSLATRECLGEFSALR